MSDHQRQLTRAVWNNISISARFNWLNDIGFTGRAVPDLTGILWDNLPINVQELLAESTGTKKRPTLVDVANEVAEREPKKSLGEQKLEAVLILAHAYAYLDDGARGRFSAAALIMVRFYELLTMSMFDFKREGI